MTLLLAAALAWGHPDAHERIDQLTARLGSRCDAELLLRRARAHADGGHRAEVGADLATARTCAADASAVDRAAGLLWLELGAPERARQALETRLGVHPDDRAAHLAHGRALAALERYADADRALTQALGGDLQPTPDAIVLWADVRRSAGDPAAALDAVSHGAEHIGWVPALSALAVELEVELERYDAAIARLDAALAGSPNALGLALQRARVLASAGRPAEARAALHDVLARWEHLPVRLKNDAMGSIRREAEAELARL